jgi:hypothetical protein
MDVLGWKDKIKKTCDENSNTNFNELNKIYNTYTGLKKSFKEIEDNYDDNFKLNIISDSIFISWDSEVPILTRSIFRTLSYQLKVMAYNDFLVRGGLKKGSIIHEDEILFGPALTEAYYLQDKCSIYPRVIFEKEVKRDFKHRKIHILPHEIEELDLVFNEFVKKDVDGFYYLDYFDLNNCEVLENYNRTDITQRDYYNKLKVIITEGCSLSDPNLRMKYEWMKGKYNEAIQKNVEQTKENFLIGKVAIKKK